MAGEHPTVPILRPISNGLATFASIAVRQPPSDPFQSATARHDMSAALLTQWAVVRATAFASPFDFQAWTSMGLQQVVDSFRVPVQGATPGLQTVPQAELHAAGWVAMWLRQHPAHSADLYTGCACAQHVWQTMQSACSVRALRFDTALTGHFVGHQPLRLHKVKAYNRQGRCSPYGPCLP